MMSDGKPKVAFFDFAGCEGCQLTVIDALQTNLDLLDAIEIVQFREAMSEKGNDYHIAFVEGSCTRPSDEERLKAIRNQAKILIALGACAHLGGVNTVRNLQALDDVRHYVYGDRADQYETYTARSIEKVVPIDGFIPGCPIDRREFVRAVKNLLQGNLPSIPDYPLCVECKLKENLCVYERGMICLGPITRAGCGALCPSFGAGCEGCRGMIPNPNLTSLREVMLEHGASEPRMKAILNLFMTQQVLESEVGSHGD